MIEGRSSFERIVGDIPQDEKSEILDDMKERFKNQAYEDLVGKEREKTPEELHIIELANKISSDFCHEFGIAEPLDIPPRNIHMIKDEKWPSNNQGGALYNYAYQAIAAREEPSKMIFAVKMLHEMIHFKSYQALQITTGAEPKLEEYRAGLTMTQRGGQTELFTALNEAVTEEIVKYLIPRLFADPIFQDEIEETKKVITEHPMAITNDGEPLYDADTYFAHITNNDQKCWRAAVRRFFGLETRTKIATGGLGYVQERAVLDSFAQKICKSNSNLFQSKNDVLKEFFKGMITGNMVSMIRTIDSTYGIGTVRSLGKLDTNLDQLEKFVKAL